MAENIKSVFDYIEEFKAEKADYQRRQEEYQEKQRLKKEERQRQQKERQVEKEHYQTQVRERKLDKKEQRRAEAKQRRDEKIKHQQQKKDRRNEQRLEKKERQRERKKRLKELWLHYGVPRAIDSIREFRENLIERKETQKAEIMQRLLKSSGVLNEVNELNRVLLNEKGLILKGRILHWSKPSRYLFRERSYSDLGFIFAWGKVLDGGEHGEYDYIEVNVNANRRKISINGLKIVEREWLKNQNIIRRMVAKAYMEPRTYHRYYDYDWSKKYDRRKKEDNWGEEYDWSKEIE